MIRRYAEKRFHGLELLLFRLYMILLFHYCSLASAFHYFAIYFIIIFDFR